MRNIIVYALLALPAAAWAQSGRINLDIPPSLAAKATESVDVNLDGALLRLASKFLSEDDADERDTRELVRKLDGIYVRSYEFDVQNAYDPSVVARLRSQLGAEWK